MSAEEKTEWLRQIAMMTGWSAKEIAEHLPVSYTWVMLYLPDEFKDKTMAEWGKKGGEARAEEVDKRKATSLVAEESEDTRQPPNSIERMVEQAF